MGRLLLWLALGAPLGLVALGVVELRQRARSGTAFPPALGTVSP